MQRIVVAAGNAAVYLEGIECHGFRAMSADQLPEILLTVFETVKCRLPRLAALPLQKAQHAAAVVAGLHAGTEKTVVALSQTLGLRRQCRNQRGLLTRFNLEFDQLGKAAIAHGKPPLILKRALRPEELQGKTSS